MSAFGAASAKFLESKETKKQETNINDVDNIRKVSIQPDSKKNSLRVYYR